MSGFVTARWIILCLRTALVQSSTVLISVFALYWCPGHSELPVSADFPSLHPWMGDREEVWGSRLLLREALANPQLLAVV